MEKHNLDKKSRGDKERDVKRKKTEKTPRFFPQSYISGIMIQEFTG